MNRKRREKWPLVVLGAGLALGWCAAQAGAAQLVLSNNATGGGSVVTSRGSTITVRVSLVSEVPFTGVTYFLRSGSASDGFAITGRSVDGSSPLTDVTTDDATVFSGGNALLNPINAVDLGAGAADVTTNFPAGTYTLGTLSLLVPSTMPAGSYYLSLTGGVITDNTFGETAMADSASLLVWTTAAVPEPGAGVLAVIGVGMVGLRRRRRGW